MIFFNCDIKIWKTYFQSGSSVCFSTTDRMTRISQLETLRIRMRRDANFCAPSDAGREIREKFIILRFLFQFSSAGTLNPPGSKIAATLIYGIPFCFGGNLITEC